jgi:hypothetical protein
MLVEEAGVTTGAFYVVDPTGRVRQAHPGETRPGDLVVCWDRDGYVVSEVGRMGPASILLPVCTVRGDGDLKSLESILASRTSSPQRQSLTGLLKHLFSRIHDGQPVSLAVAKAAVYTWGSVKPAKVFPLDTYRFLFLTGYYSDWPGQVDAEARGLWNLPIIARYPVGHTRHVEGVLQVLRQIARPVAGTGEEVPVYWVCPSGAVVEVSLNDGGLYFIWVGAPEYPGVDRDRVIRAARNVADYLASKVLDLIPATA